MDHISLLPWIRRAIYGRNIRVVVVGDLILDEYLEGKVQRISPEAPVPVHSVTRTFHSAGGAANVARNIRLAGGDTTILGVWGNDEGARQLAQLLDQDGIDISGVLQLSDRPTTRKTRVTSSHQQLVRIDWERVDGISSTAQDQILGQWQPGEADALILSDYGKGTLPESLTRALLAKAKRAGIKAIVDPKGTNYERYRDAFIVTPNRKEATEALGAEAAAWSPESLARGLLEKYHLENVLVTLGPEGMLFLSRDDIGTPMHLPAEAREVYDVSGAGDTVVAILSLCLGAGLDVPASMTFANVAAGRVVEKWGTQPITRAELESCIALRHNAPISTLGPGKLLNNQADLDRLLGNERIVLAYVDPDRLDDDLLDQLEDALHLGSALVVKVTRRPDEAAWEYLRRCRWVKALDCVSFVVDPGSPDIERWVRKRAEDRILLCSGKNEGKIFARDDAGATDASSGRKSLPI